MCADRGYAQPAPVPVDCVGNVIDVLMADKWLQALRRPELLAGSSA